MGTIKSFYFEIPEGEKDTMNLVMSLLKKLGINVREVENKIDNLENEKNNLDYEQAKTSFFNKYVGSINISDNAEEDYNQHRMNKYGK